MNLILGDSKLSLASLTRRKLSGKSLSVSMQNIRDTVHRISHPHQSLSRTSLNTEKKDKAEISSTPIINDEDTISLQIPDVQSQSSMYHLYRCIRRGLVVRISAFHAGGPGSIPGVGILFFFLLTLFFIYSIRLFLFLNACFSRSKSAYAKIIHAMTLCVYA